MTVFTFIDLCCGIGGFTEALVPLGGTCVLAADVDPLARRFYELNHGHAPVGDLFDVHDAPEADVVTAGFPCQPFSKAGKLQGFDDPRGNVFWGVADIIRQSRPSVVLLENVQNFARHDRGRTMALVLQVLDDMGFRCQPMLCSSSEFGVPQSRPKTYILAVKDRSPDIDPLPQRPFDRRCIHDLLDHEASHCYVPKEDYVLIDNPKTQRTGLIFAGYMTGKGKSPRRMHGERLDLTLSRCHRQPNRIYSSQGTHPTISSQESSARFYIHDGVGVRKFNKLELTRLQGYRDDFILPDTLKDVVKLLGNSITPAVPATIMANLLRRHPDLFAPQRTPELL